MRGDLERLARRLGVDSRLTFTGVVQREALPSWLAAFDIALQPAVTTYASPLKLIEYLAMGKAIVAPDQPNIRELLAHDSNAWLFRPGDPDALCEALCTLAADRARRQRLSHGALGTIFAKKLTWEDNAKQIVAAARRLAGSAATDPALPVA